MIATAAGAVVRERCRRAPGVLGLRLTRHLPAGSPTARAYV